MDWNNALTKEIFRRWYKLINNKIVVASWVENKNYKFSSVRDRCFYDLLIYQSTASI